VLKGYRYTSRLISSLTFFIATWTNITKFSTISGTHYCHFNNEIKLMSVMH